MFYDEAFLSKQDEKAYKITNFKGATAYHYLDFLKHDLSGDHVDMYFANFNSPVLKIHKVKFANSEKEAYLQKLSSLVMLKYGDKQRHLALLVNPFSGKKKAKEYVDNHAVPFFELVGLKYTLIETESTQFMYDWVNSFKTFEEIPYTDFVLCSGDGTMNHLINAIYNHPQGPRIIETIPIGLIPGGSACGVPKSIGGTTVNRGVINQIRG